ncbi:hypothetical protein [Streptomyces sp. AA1529]|uniref:hypothetical protein n=1 Tax=Streptomyces sp. AA1529 TaxID=1203257 RepID=UPI000382BFF3|nr:hypothetical protein [Streptomyces sp. AA1529]
MALTIPAPAPEGHEQCSGFIPDAPRAPGLCAACGDSQRWHQAADEQYEADCQTLRDAMKGATSDADRSVYALDLYLLAHPEACHTDADYPGWTPGGAA